ncbi:MAG: HAD family phosphatase [Cyclobacteriaceae bacterium]|jgi:2-haloacid dehalogenase|nr:HAD family phosphatase [Cyclobacteriaceae bacterium]
MTKEDELAKGHIDTIIFDLGAVLVDWNPRYLYRKIFSTEEEITWFLENVCTPEWNEKQDAGRSFAEATEELVSRFPEQEGAIRAWYGRWQETIQGDIPGTVEVFRELRATGRFRFYALTNWSEETFPWAQQRFHFLQWFDGMVVSGVEKTRKPFPEFYRILFDRYGVNPAQAVFIDDNMANVTGGRAVGLHAIHFQSPEQLRHALAEMSLLG